MCYAAPRQSRKYRWLHAADLNPRQLRYDSIGSDPARERADRARGSIAGSLSIEPFGPSRWRLRRTRPLSYVGSIVGAPGFGGSAGTMRSDRDGDDAQEVVAASRAVAKSGVRTTHLRRSRVPACHKTAGESCASPTRCHEGRQRGACRGRAVVRSAVRRCAWAPRTADTARMLVTVR